MGVVVTPIQMISGERSSGRSSPRYCVSLLWTLLWDVILPGAGLAVGGIISARAFAGTPSMGPKRKMPDLNRATAQPSQSPPSTPHRAEPRVVHRHFPSSIQQHQRCVVDAPYVSKCIC